MKNRMIFMMLLVICTSLLAKSYDEYQFNSTLLTNDKSWQKLYIPLDMYEKTASDFKDIRLLSISENKDTIEEPYFIEKEQDKRSVQKIDFKLINEVRNRGGYYYTFDVGQRQAINQIELFLNRNNFDKYVRLEGSQDMNEWFTILRNQRILAISNDQTAFRHTSLNFKEAQYQYFRVLIKGSSNPFLKKAQLKMLSISPGELDSIAGVEYSMDNDSKSGITIIDVKLEKLTPIDKIQIRFKDTLDYYRPFKMSIVTDSFKTEKGWIVNYRKFYSGTLSSFQKADLTFSTVLTKTIRIEIVNHDNQSLSLSDISVQAFKQAMFTRIQGSQGSSKHVLVYGNSNVNHPSYDIIHFKKEIPANISVATLENEVENSMTAEQSVNPLFENENWLWAIMGVVIVVIGGFTFKMMKGEN